MAVKESKEGLIAMFYNQNDYPDVPYPWRDRPNDSIADAGCGLCACCMIVEALTGKTYTPPEAAKLALAVGARDAGGSDISLLAPAVCGIFRLHYELTNDAGRVLQFLQDGRGMVVANPGGDREGWVGVFTDTGHYIVLAAAQGREIKVWDPMLRPGRYDKEGRRGKARVEGNDAFADIAVIAKDCDNRTPAYTLIWR